MIALRLSLALAVILTMTLVAEKILQVQISTPITNEPLKFITEPELTDGSAEA